MNGTEIALIITASGAFLTSIVGATLSLRNGWNIKRIEKNTNSISERNEAIARKVGVLEGRAEEKANPS